MSAYIEQDCKVSFQNREFESGGSFLAPDKNGRLGGIFYAYSKDGCIGNWRGTLKIPARFAREYRSNMGDLRQGVYFEYEGKSFYGIYYKSGSDIVRVREIQK